MLHVHCFSAVLVKLLGISNFPYFSISGFLPFSLPAPIFPASNQGVLQQGSPVTVYGTRSVMQHSSIPDSINMHTKTAQNYQATLTHTIKLHHTTLHHTFLQLHRCSVDLGVHCCYKRDAR